MPIYIIEGKQKMSSQYQSLESTLLAIHSQKLQRDEAIIATHLQKQRQLYNDVYLYDTLSSSGSGFNLGVGVSRSWVYESGSAEELRGCVRGVQAEVSECAEREIQKGREQIQQELKKLREEIERMKDEEMTDTHGSFCEEGKTVQGAGQGGYEFIEDQKLRKFYENTLGLYKLWNPKCGTSPSNDELVRWIHEMNVNLRLNKGIKEKKQQLDNKQQKAQMKPVKENKVRILQNSGNQDRRNEQNSSKIVKNRRERQLTLEKLSKSCIVKKKKDKQSIEQNDRSTISRSKQNNRQRKTPKAQKKQQPIVKQLLQSNVLDHLMQNISVLDSLIGKKLSGKKRKAQDKKVKNEHKKQTDLEKTNSLLESNNQKQMKASLKQRKSKLKQLADQDKNALDPNNEGQYCFRYRRYCQRIASIEKQKEKSKQSHEHLMNIHKKQMTSPKKQLKNKS